MYQFLLYCDLTLFVGRRNLSLHEKMLKIFQNSFSKKINETDVNKDILNLTLHLFDCSAKHPAGK